MLTGIFGLLMDVLAWILMAKSGVMAAHVGMLEPLKLWTPDQVGGGKADATRP